MNKYHFDLMKREECGLYDEFAKYLRGTNIINGGSIVASPDAFQRLEYYMIDEWKGCNDQLTLNVLVRAKILKNITITIHRQGEGVINVVGYSDGAVLQDSNQKFLNLNCIASPVVHQYDIVKPGQVNHIY